MLDFFPAGGFHTAVAAREFLHAACGVNKLLLSGKERVACRTNPDFDVRFRGTGAVGRAACATDDCFLILRMNFCFHE